MRGQTLTHILTTVILCDLAPSPVLPLDVQEPDFPGEYRNQFLGCATACTPARCALGRKEGRCSGDVASENLRRWKDEMIGNARSRRSRAFRCACIEIFARRSVSRQMFPSEFTAARNMRMNGNWVERRGNSEIVLKPERTALKQKWIYKRAEAEYSRYEWGMPSNSDKRICILYSFLTWKYFDKLKSIFLPKYRNASVFR